METIKRLIDPYLVFLLALIGIWWIFSAWSETPAKSISKLEKSKDVNKWITALASSDRQVRNFAKKHIVDNFSVDELSQAVTQALAKDDPWFQLAGLWLLSESQIPGAGEMASKFLNSKDADIKIAALKVLSKFPFPPVHGIIAGMTEDSNETVQNAAVNALASDAREEDLNLFLKFLNMPYSDAREAAIKGITEIASKNRASLTTLIQYASQSDRNTTYEIINIIGKLGDESAIRPLFDLLKYGPPALANEVTKAIGAIGGEEARTLARQLFLSGEDNERRAAAKVLKLIKDKSMSSKLAAIAFDESEDFWLRLYSMEALGTCGTEDLVPETLRFIENRNNDPRLVRAALEAVGGMGDEKVLDLYDKILNRKADIGYGEDSGESDRLAVVTGLGYMDTEDARERLRNILRHSNLEDTEIIIEAIRSLGKIGEPEDIDLIMKERKGRPLVTQSANEAVESIRKRFPQNQ